MSPETVVNVWRAWNVPGTHPDYHRRAQQKLRKDWPTLANALDQLIMSTASTDHVGAIRRPQDVIDELIASGMARDQAIRQIHEDLKQGKIELTSDFKIKYLHNWEENDGH